MDFVEELSRNGADAAFTKTSAGRMLVQGLRSRGVLAQTVNNAQSRLLIRQLPDAVTGGRISELAVDVSHSLEVGTIYRHLASTATPGQALPFARLVVDIGANDGLLSSNSYNFVAWGWSAVLVEPLSKNLKLALQNQKPLLRPALYPQQTLCPVEAALSGQDKDTSMNLLLSPDVVDMEGRLVTGSEAHSTGASMVKVPVISIDTLVRKCPIPLRFGVLSIDAEGVGTEILQAFLSKGYRPQYIIHEWLHNKPLPSGLLEKAGYKILAKKLGWNQLFVLSESAAPP